MQLSPATKLTKTDLAGVRRSILKLLGRPEAVQLPEQNLLHWGS